MLAVNLTGTSDREFTIQFVTIFGQFSLTYAKLDIVDQVNGAQPVQIIIRLISVFRRFELGRSQVWQVVNKLYNL